MSYITLSTDDFVILGVYHIDTYFWCGCYYFNIDGDYITTLDTNEKFASLKEFEMSVKSKGIYEEDAKIAFYDEELDDWISTLNL